MAFEHLLTKNLKSGKELSAFKRQPGMFWHVARFILGRNLDKNVLYSKLYLYNYKGTMQNLTFERQTAYFLGGLYNLLAWAECVLPNYRNSSKIYTHVNNCQAGNFTVLPPFMFVYAAKSYWFKIISERQRWVSERLDTTQYHWP